MKRLFLESEVQFIYSNYVSIFMPLPHCLCYCSFVVRFEIPQIIFYCSLFLIAHIFLVTNFQFSLFNIFQTGLVVPPLPIYWFGILIVVAQVKKIAS